MSTRGRRAVPIKLSPQEEEFLKTLASRRNAPAIEVRRAKAVLMMAQGHQNKVIAEEVGACQQTIGTWRSKFDEMRLVGISDLPRSGPPRTISDEKAQEVVETTLQFFPLGATHWSNRKMARDCGLSHDSVARIWKAFGLQPHRTESFQLSNDPYYVDKDRDVVRLYMSPPENALVLSVDEKSQIQALQRTQPVLPLRPGQVERQTPEYFRHGTLSLFAALDIKTGEVLGNCYRRRRAQEFLNFLKTIEQQVAGQLKEGYCVHLILDNYCTHKSATVCRWLAKRPHWHLHFTPTHASWMNQVERFFAKITTEAIRRGSFNSVGALKEAIDKYLDQHNQNPSPLKWVASDDSLLGRTTQLFKGLV